jgi:hypothetical protein
MRPRAASKKCIWSAHSTDSRLARCRSLASLRPGRNPPPQITRWRQPVHFAGSSARRLSSRANSGSPARRGNAVRVNMKGCAGRAVAGHTQVVGVLVAAVGVDDEHVVAVVHQCIDMAPPSQRDMKQVVEEPDRQAGVVQCPPGPKQRGVPGAVARLGGISGARCPVAQGVWRQLNSMGHNTSTLGIGRLRTQARKSSGRQRRIGHRQKTAYQVRRRRRPACARRWP